MIAKSISLFFLICLFNLNYAQTDFTELNKIIEEAIELNPNIKMLHAKLEAANTKPAQNSNLPDPVLSIGAMNMPVNSFSFKQEPMTGKMIALSQAFPFPGKLSAASELHSKDAEVVHEEIEEQQNRLRMKIAKAYFHLSFLREKIETIKTTQELFKTIKEVVQTKYEVNEASQQHIFKIELELTRLDEDLSDLNAQEKFTLATINSYLFRNVASHIGSVDLETLSTYDALPTNDLLKLAKVNKPALKQIEILQTKAKEMENVADYDFYPDFNLQLQYSQREEIARTNTDLQDFFSVIVGIKLPINYGGKKSSKVDEALSMQTLYEQQYQNTLQMLQISLETSLAKLNSLEERSQIIEKGSLLQAEENFSSALSSYQVNKVDFINVTEALTKLLNLQTNLYKVRADYYKEIAGLEFLTGTYLFGQLN